MIDGDLPKVSEVRQRISHAKPDVIKYILMDLYLKAGRVSESVSVKAPRDTTTAYGPTGADAAIEEIDGHEAVILTVKTAKRQGKERLVALPTETEPWAKPLYNYYKSFGDESVFPVTRQYVWLHAKPFFEGFKYPIESYKKKMGTGEIQVVPGHSRTFALHALRHLRATELVRVFHFKAEDLAAYCGWRLTTVTKATSVMERYIDLGAYLEYFPKLLKKNY